MKKINDQEMVSDMYMQSRYGITLDYGSNIFQAMHATHAAPLAECDPWPDMTIDGDGCWSNKDTNTRPSIFHYNGGGKSHHLPMEQLMWYVGRRLARSEATSRSNTRRGPLGPFEHPYLASERSERAVRTPRRGHHLMK